MPGEWHTRPRDDQSTDNGSQKYVSDKVDEKEPKSIDLEAIELHTALNPAYQKVGIDIPLDIPISLMFDMAKRGRLA